MNKYLKILLVLGLIAFPASLQADTITVTPPATPSRVVITPSVSKLVTLTAYASVPNETDSQPFITASGDTVADGIVAANFLPFGTKIQIPSIFGSKIFTVEDRTNKKFSGRVDIWMPSVEKAITFGLHRAKIVILDSAMAVK